MRGFYSQAFLFDLILVFFFIDFVFAVFIA